MEPLTGMLLELVFFAKMLFELVFWSKYPKFQFLGIQPKYGYAIGDALTKIKHFFSYHITEERCLIFNAGACLALVFNRCLFARSV